VKKQVVKQVRASREDVGHLNETLTDLTTRTATRFKKWWKPLALVLVIAIAAQGAYLFLQHLAEREKARSNQEVYEIFESAAARQEGYLPDAARLEALLKEVKGKEEEKLIVAKAVAFYLEKAQETKEDGPRAERLERARSLAREIAERYPADGDLKSWAATVADRVEGDKQKAWLKDKRTYRPPVPGTTPPPEEAGAQPATPATAAAPATENTATQAAAPAVEEKASTPPAAGESAKEAAPK
jgi:hypothetical protein